MLYAPRFVDCNEDAIVTSDYNKERVYVFQWSDGVNRVVISPTLRLRGPGGVRLLRDGSGFVVVDYSESRWVVLSLTGQVLKSGTDGMVSPWGVVEADGGDSFVIMSYKSALVKVASSDGRVIGQQRLSSTSDGYFYKSSGLCLVPSRDGVLMAVLDPGNKRVQVFKV